jgi:hypothetical protein
MTFQLNIPIPSIDGLILITVGDEPIEQASRLDAIDEYI